MAEQQSPGGGSEGGRGLRRLPRLEVAPPAWLVRAVTPKPAPFPWPETVDAVLAITGPLAFGVVTGQVAISSFLAMGGLTVGMTNARGPLGWKLRRSIWALIAAAAGLLLGIATHGEPAVAIGTVILLSLFAALLSVVGAIASLASLQLLVYAAVGGGLAGPVPILLPPAAMLVGGVWGLALTVATGLVVGYRQPEREAVALVFQRVAELLAATGAPWMEQSRRALTDALNQAFDTVLGVRARTGGRDWSLLRLAGLLNASTPLVEATVAIAHSGRRPPPDLYAAASRLAEAVRRQDGVPRAAVDGVEGAPLLDAWVGAYRGVLSGWDKAALPPAPPGPAERLRSIADQILSGRGTWRFVVRLVLCMTIAEILDQVLPLAHSYWIVMTVALVLKPDFGSIFVRGLQRGLGTIAGVILGFGIVLMLPDNALLLVGVAALSAVLPYAILRNYGMFATFLTPVVLILIELAAPSGARTVGLAAGEARLANTVIGCGVALVAGYALWPDSWRSQLPSHIAESASLLADYLALAFRPDRAMARQLRRRTYRSLSDLRTSFQQTLSEPPPASTRAAAWWPVVAQLEMVTDAVTEAAVAARNGGPAPDPEHVAQCVEAVRDIAAQVSRGSPRKVPRLEFPDDPPIEAVASGIRVSQRILAAKPPSRRGRRRRADGTARPRSGFKTTGSGSTDER